MREKFKSLGLSNREADVAQEMAMGLDRKEIAAKLFVSLSAVAWHMARIYMILKVPGRNKFMVFCARNFSEFYK